MSPQGKSSSSPRDKRPFDYCVYSGTPPRLKRTSSSSSSLSPTTSIAATAKETQQDDNCADSIRATPKRPIADAPEHNNTSSRSHHGPLCLPIPPPPSNSSLLLLKYSPPPPRPRPRRRGLRCDRIRRTNDEIHSTIDLCPVLCEFIDTPFVQRLKGLKQLGTADCVYMNCNGTRFEHSIGVSHLAQQLLTHLQQRQAFLPVSSSDLMCVSLAGLLHDVGHGPFSHAYEVFQQYHWSNTITRNNNNNKPSSISSTPLSFEEDETMRALYSDTVWPPDCPYISHERVSLKMIHAILESWGLAVNIHALDEPLQEIDFDPDPATIIHNNSNNTTQHQHGQGTQLLSAYALKAQDDRTVLTSRDMLFVMECISGAPVREYESILGPGFHGRPRHKEWMYDIVCNVHSGLDVDKIDYYARDERRAFKGAGEIDVRMMEDAYVAWAVCSDPNRCPKCKYRCSSSHSRTTANTHPLQQQQQHHQHLMIVYPTKLIPSCIDFFKKRFELHSKIYSHKTAIGAQYLLLDILAAADPYFRLPILNKSNYHHNNNNTIHKQQKQECTPYTSLPISRAYLDTGVFVRCKDSIIDEIANTTSPQLEKARHLIHRLWSRDIYKCAISIVVNMDDVREAALWNLSDSDVMDGMLQVRGEHTDAHTGETLTLTREDIIVHHTYIHHGSKDANPLQSMRFLEKTALAKLNGPVEHLPMATPVPDRRYDARLPRHFAERSLLIYSRNAAKTGLLRHCFHQWYTELQGEIECTPPPPLLMMIEGDSVRLRNDGARGASANATSSCFVCSQESDVEDNYEFMEEEDTLVRAGYSAEGAVGKVTPSRRRRGHDL